MVPVTDLVTETFSGRSGVVTHTTIIGHRVVVVVVVGMVRVITREIQASQSSVVIAFFYRFKNQIVQEQTDFTVFVVIVVTVFWALVVVVMVTVVVVVVTQLGFVIVSVQMGLFDSTRTGFVGYVTVLSVLVETGG